MQGWIKLHRELTKWEWYQDAHTMRVFLHLLLMANHKEAKWKGNIIGRGQRITSYNHIASELGLTVQNVRTSISKLKSTENLTIKSTNKFTIVSICNYDTYQSENDDANTQTNKRLTNDQQTTNKQLTTNKNDKNKKEEKRIAECLVSDEVIDNQEALESNTSEASSLGTKPSWHGFEDINGYALRNEPKEGTLIRNPRTGEITEYEK